MVAASSGSVLGREEGVEHLGDDRLGGEAQAEGQDVGVVPPSSAASRLRVGAQRGPHARHLVGGHGDARARPAADDADVASPVGDPFADPAADVGPRVTFAHHVDVVALLGQHLAHVIRHGRALVGPEGDPHDQRFARRAPVAGTGVRS